MLKFSIPKFDAKVTNFGDFICGYTISDVILLLCLKIDTILLPITLLFFNMKRILLSLFSLFALSLTLCATQIWEGNTAINWNNAVSISAESFVEASVSDHIQVQFQSITGQGHVQLRSSAGVWVLVGTSGADLTEGMTTQDFIITSEMLAEIQANGLVVTGYGFNMTGVALNAGTEEERTKYKNYVWIGNHLMKGDYSTPLSLPAETFANAAVGNRMRIHTTDWMVNAQISPCNSSWAQLAGTSQATVFGMHCDYTITQAMLNELKSGGIKIHGAGFTITGFEITPADQLSKLTFQVPVINKWVWDSTTPQLSIRTLNRSDKSEDLDITLKIMTDKLAPYKEMSQKVTAAPKKATEAHFNLELEPGFYNCMFVVNGEMAYHTFTIGYQPTKISSPVDAQPDFDTFWETALNELSQVEPQYSLTLLPEKSSSKRNVYFVEMKSIGDATGDDITIRGYYAEPVGEGTYPAFVEYQGYGAQPYCMNADDNPEYCEFILSARGQVINSVAPYTNPYGDWILHHLEDENKFFYRGAFMDVVRAIDFIASRPKVQPENIFATGISQGGAYTIVAAALDNRLNAVAPAVPFLGDFPDYLDMALWPCYSMIAQSEKEGMSRDELERVLSYFDTKNLAPRITIPYHTTIGLQDNVCPPHTNFAPYNNLVNVPDSEKSYEIHTDLYHQTPGSWTNTVLKFFDNHLKTSSIDDISIDKATSYTVYNLQGMLILQNCNLEALKALPSGIYIINNKKIKL